MIMCMRKVVLICSECGHREWGYADKSLMNKIKMLNHVKASHPEFMEAYVRELHRFEEGMLRTYAVEQFVE
jgi:hypothetical protein